MFPVPILYLLAMVKIIGLNSFLTRAIAKSSELATGPNVMIDQKWHCVFHCTRINVITGRAYHTFMSLFQHKICHRDLKLENILLDEYGNAKVKIVLPVNIHGCQSESSGGNDAIW